MEKLLIEDVTNRQTKKDQESDRLKTIDDNILKITTELTTLSSEFTEVKNNLLLMSEIITKLTGVESVTVTRSTRSHYVFAQFVEDSLDKLTKVQSEAAVLEIVEVLHKYKTKCDSQDSVLLNSL